MKEAATVQPNTLPVTQEPPSPTRYLPNLVSEVKVVPMPVWRLTRQITLAGWRYIRPRHLLRQ